MINLDKYITAWKERRRGKTYKKIGLLMGITDERVRTMFNIINYKIKRKGKKSLKILELTAFDKKLQK